MLCFSLWQLLDSYNKRNTAGTVASSCRTNSFYVTVLPQTNLQFNNNKYYLIQLLEDDAQQNFSVWMRWGRGKGFMMD